MKTILTPSSFISDYWLYYLQLENDFLSTLKYVEFNETNYKTYSIEFLRLYLAVCSEIDVLGKVLAKFCDEKFKPEDRKNNIIKWSFEVQSDFNLAEQRVCFKDFSTELIPWKNFVTESKPEKPNQKVLKENCQTPLWWRNYNSVKHNRAFIHANGETNYKKANLRNLTNAFGALFILEQFCFKKLNLDASNNSIKQSKLFKNL